MKVRLSIATTAAVAAALSLTLSAGAANRPGDYNVRPKPEKWGWVFPNPWSIGASANAVRPNPWVSGIGRMTAFRPNPYLSGRVAA
jgi:hypothetical protein